LHKLDRCTYAAAMFSTKAILTGAVVVLTFVAGCSSDSTGTGSSGTSGTSGTSGSSGTSGTSGTSGSTGSTTTEKYSCSLNDVCYKCSSSEGVSKCSITTGPGPGCSQTDKSYCD